MNEVRYRQAERRLWDSYALAPTEQRLELRTVGASVRVQELGSGPTVLFVHGATNGGTSWAPLVAGLPDFSCVVLDRPGCGLSDPRPGRFADIDALGAFAETLIVEVLDALGVERAHIVATSFGGYMALRSAARHPDRIDRVVQFSWPFGASAPPASVRAATVPLIGRLMSSVPPTRRTTRALLRRIGLKRAVDSGRFTPAMMDWYFALLHDTDTLRNELRAGPRLPLGRMDDRALLPRSLLNDISTPMRFLWGEEDEFGDASVGRSFVEHLPNASLELWPHAGHAPWIDAPERAATATREFLLPKGGA